MRFKRRRRPVEWITTNYSSAPDYDGAKYGILPLATLVYGGATAVSPYNPIVSATPILVGDEPDVTNTLTEERKTYTIRRIVGDLHFAWGRDGSVGTGGTAGIHPAMVKWGFGVQDVPPDIASLAATPEQVWDPFSDQQRWFTEMDWMSMCTEIYGANFAASRYISTINGGDVQENSWTSTGIIQDVTGYYYPPARHHKVDVRVNRTVRRNQRLFLTIGVSGMSTDDALYNWKLNPHRLLVWSDLRVLINWKSAFNRRS